MIISKVILDNCLFYHLHAEQTITAAFSEGRNLGVLERELTLSTLDKVVADINLGDAKNFEALILNFDGIEAIQNNSLSKISNFNKSFKRFILINLHVNVAKDLGIEDLFEYEENIINASEFYEKFYISKPDDLKFEVSTESIFGKIFFNKLTNKYVDDVSIDNSFHSSSSIYLPKWINIKKFITNEKAFFTYAIYYLAIKAYHKWKHLFTENATTKPVLVCQNLNSSYIASVLSNLLQTDILILDQIGPVNKMYSTLDSKIENNKNYLVVSDLVCLGTEVKIAKSLIEFLGGDYVGNISIVRIQTIDPVHKDFDNTECVFLVNKMNNKKIGFKINTDLEN